MRSLGSWCRQSTSTKKSSPKPRAAIGSNLAFATWKDAGVTPAITQHDDDYTGAADIFVEEATGNNAIIICPDIGIGHSVIQKG